MSIGIYAFLRIYFLGFGVSVFAQFRTHGARPPAPRRRPDLPGAACLVSSADRCSVSSVRACRGLCFWVRWPVLLFWGWKLPPPLGYMGRAGGWGGQSLDFRSPRKRRFSAFILPTPTPPSQNETHLIVQVSKFSKK
nr:MAG TPA: hypothetical protein [Caudoviricetes sp.]